MNGADEVLSKVQRTDGMSRTRKAQEDQPPGRFEPHSVRAGGLSYSTSLSGSGVPV
jgi:hypothetical protein